MINELSGGIQYVIMPIEVLQDNSLTASEKILYCYLTLFKKQCCFQSNDRLEEMTGLDKSTVKRGLRKLAEMGYVFIEYVNGNSAARRIYVVVDNPKKLEYLAKAGAFKGKPSKEMPVERAESPSEAVMPENTVKYTKPARMPRRSDFATSDEYEKAIYAWHTVVV